jgi:mannose-1-phosphate guanylyltransferase
MKALLLVGGFGTRLRPLTLSRPKPTIEILNQPIIVHQLTALVACGVDHAILAVSFPDAALKAKVDQWAIRLNVRIDLLIESSPLGTAGPIRYARDCGMLATDEPFFVLNSDVLCPPPFADLLRRHRATDAVATILTVPVKDPSRFGVVVADSHSRVERFVEKPATFVGNQINAGVYVLSPAVIDRIPPRNVSIEREIFPALAASSELFCLPLPADAYWMDVGRPTDYLAGTARLLEHHRELGYVLAAGDGIRGRVLVSPAAHVHHTALLGPDVVVGPQCVVGPTARVERSVLLPGSRVADAALVRDSIIGWHSAIGCWARVTECVVGEDCRIADTIACAKTSVLPHVTVRGDVHDTVIMD